MPRPAKTEKTSPYFIREWRSAMGLTLEQLAAEIGMSSTNLGKIERGRVLVKILRSAGDGTFHLLSNSLEEPLLNERVTWAARVKDVRPR